jgi:hypothetical protein
MQNIKRMKGFEPHDCLHEYTPNIFLFEKLIFLFMFDYFLIEVTIVGKLHYDAASNKEYHRFLPYKKTCL